MFKKLILSLVSFVITLIFLGDVYADALGTFLSSKYGVSNVTSTYLLYRGMNSIRYKAGRLVNLSGSGLASITCEEADFYFAYGYTYLTHVTHELSKHIPN